MYTVSPVYTRVVRFSMEKLSCRNLWGPIRKTILFDSLKKSVYETDSIRDGLGVAQEQKLLKIVKIEKNAWFTKNSCNYCMMRSSLKGSLIISIEYSPSKTFFLSIGA